MVTSNYRTYRSAPHSRYGAEGRELEPSGYVAGRDGTSVIEVRKNRRPAPSIPVHLQHRISTKPPCRRPSPPTVTTSTSSSMGPVVFEPPTIRWREEHPYLPDFRRIVHIRQGPLSSDNQTPPKTSKNVVPSPLSPGSLSMEVVHHSTTHKNIYDAQCFCGRVRYQVRGEPSSAKLCHCQACQLLHGAPLEWVALFDKQNVRFPDPSSLEYLYFYNSQTDKAWDSSNADRRELPVKVSCTHCRTPIADEGTHLWLGFCPLFGFVKEDDSATHDKNHKKRTSYKNDGRMTIHRINSNHHLDSTATTNNKSSSHNGGIPRAFRPSCHLFYKQRCMDIRDDKTKWEGQCQQSPKWHPQWAEP